MLGFCFFVWLVFVVCLFVLVSDFQERLHGSVYLNQFCKTGALNTSAPLGLGSSAFQPLKTWVLQHLKIEVFDSSPSQDGATATHIRRYHVPYLGYVLGLEFLLMRSC